MTLSSDKKSYKEFTKLLLPSPNLVEPEVFNESHHQTVKQPVSAKRRKEIQEAEAAAKRNSINMSSANDTTEQGGKPTLAPQLYPKDISHNKQHTQYFKKAWGGSGKKLKGYEVYKFGDPLPDSALTSTKREGAGIEHICIFRRKNEEERALKEKPFEYCFYDAKSNEVLFSNQVVLKRIFKPFVEKYRYQMPPGNKMEQVFTRFDADEQKKKTTKYKDLPWIPESVWESLSGNAPRPKKQPSPAPAAAESSSKKTPPTAGSTKEDIDGISGSGDDGDDDDQQDEGEDVSQLAELERQKAEMEKRIAEAKQQQQQQKKKPKVLTSKPAAAVDRDEKHQESPATGTVKMHKADKVMKRKELPEPLQEQAKKVQKIKPTTSVKSSSTPSSPAIVFEDTKIPAFQYEVLNALKEGAHDPLKKANKLSSFWESAFVDWQLADKNTDDILSNLNKSENGKTAKSLITHVCIPFLLTMDAKKLPWVGSLKDDPAHAKAALDLVNNKLKDAKQEREQKQQPQEETDEEEEEVVEEEEEEEEVVEEEEDEEEEVVEEEEEEEGEFIDDAEDEAEDEVIEDED